MAAVREKCSGHDLANVPSVDADGSVSSCWCQHSGGENPSDQASAGAGWYTCKVSNPEDAPPVEEENSSGTADGCIGDFYRTNDFTENEVNIGAFDSVSACVNEVKFKCPDHDVANVPYDSLPNKPVSSCWCQHSYGRNLSNHENTYDSWGACMVKVDDA